jgi:hypothetical protein
MKSQRPTGIIIICIIGFFAFGLGEFSVPMLYGKLTSTYGAWSGLFWLTSLALTIAILIGYWLMNKWGIYVYVGAFVVGTIVGVLEELPFTVLGVVVPVLVSAFGLVYLRKIEQTLFPSYNKRLQRTAIRRR